MVCALAAVFLMVLTGCLNLEQAYKAIDWKVIFLLGGILPLGLEDPEAGPGPHDANGIFGRFADLVRGEMN